MTIQRRDFIKGMLAVAAACGVKIPETDYTEDFTLDFSVNKFTGLIDSLTWKTNGDFETWIKPVNDEWHHVALHREQLFIDERLVEPGQNPLGFRFNGGKLMVGESVIFEIKEG